MGGIDKDQFEREMLAWQNSPLSELEESLMTASIAGARYIDVGSTKRIWIPKTGRPFWVLADKPNAGPELTDDEIERFIRRNF